MFYVYHHQKVTAAEQLHQPWEPAEPLKCIFPAAYSIYIYKSAYLYQRKIVGCFIFNGGLFTFAQYLLFLFDQFLSHGQAHFGHMGK